MELTPYVPRLVLEWGRDTPDARYRRLGGTLAFCDLSGFTAMSEKLAALGRLGAEELADVLNLLFSELLADAAAYGGSLLKYGGDAVLLFFSGEDHAARGAAATHRMRATLRRVGTVKTSKGTVRVRMSVGIHSGEFDFFLVGDTHRELIVTGAGATITVDMEGAAEAGEILLSPDTAAALAPSCVGEAKGGGFLLKRIPRTEARDPLAWGEVPDIDPVPFIPVGLREHIGGVGADAEHRHIAVGFVAFGGVDELLVSDGRARTAEVLDGFISACQAAFARYDACFLYADVYGDGGKVFFIVGAPVSHEDNEERLLRAALEISAEHHHGLHLHTGLNRGYVFAGDVGAKFRRTYTVLGDAVNTAARVMASCNEANQVRAMPEVLDLASSRFSVEAQAPFAAKGKTLPLSTFAIGEPLGPRLSDTPLPLVGRDAEVADLTRRLEAAKAGRGGFMRVVGTAGIGKSRLVDEMVQIAEADGFATLTTFAERYEQTTVWHVLRQLLSVVFDDAHSNVTELLLRALALAPTEARWFPLLGPVFGLEITPTEESKSVDAESAPTMLGRLTLKLLDGFLDGPALWIAENGHLADEASAKAIAAVAADIGRRPWLVVGVSRDDEPGGLANLEADALVVGPLSTEDGARLARAADPALLPHDASTIAERSDGNPLFLRQLVSAAAEGGELSDSVETAVSARIDRLSTTDRDVLRTAAVLGGRFNVGDLRELLDGRAPDLAPLQDFVAMVDGSVVFRQALYREVAYEGLTFRRRRALHLAAGRLLEETDDDGAGTAERLSLHFHEAQAWPQSWEYSRKAAKNAFETTAKSVAALFFGRAFDAGRHLPDLGGEELADVAGRLAHCFCLAGRVGQARTTCKTGRRFAPKQSVVRANLDLIEAVTYLETGDIRRASPWLRRGLQTFEASAEDLSDPDVAEVGVSLLLGTADTHLRRGHFDDAERFIDRALAIATGSKVPRLIGRTHSRRMAICFSTGDVVGAEREGIACLEAFRADGKFPGEIAMQAMNVGAISQMLGKWDVAAELFAEAFSTQIRRGNDIFAAAVQVNIGDLLLDQGRWEDAETNLTDAKSVLDLAEDEGAVHAQVLLNRSRIRTGASEPVDEVDEREILGVAEMIALNNVEAAIAANDMPEAQRCLDDAASRGIEVAHASALGAIINLKSAPDSPDARDTALDAIATSRNEGDRFAALLVLSLLGCDYADDAKALGVVDLPMWAKPGRSTTTED